jgi:acetyl-CoA/propionyl-CoA carboxylase biotin carboxyl carrier protein
MLAKVIAWAPSRTEALRRLDRALAGTAVLGVGTNVAFLRSLLAHPRVAAGTMDTGLIDSEGAALADARIPDLAFVVYGLYRIQQRAIGSTDPWDTLTGWRLGEPATARWQVAPADGSPAVTVCVGTGWAAVDDRRYEAALDGELLTLDGATHRVLIASAGPTVWVGCEGGSWALIDSVRAGGGNGAGDAVAEIHSPMPGTVVALSARDGDEVETGDPMVVVEAMKMEHVLSAPRAGTAAMLVALGAQVSLGQLLARVDEP